MYISQILPKGVKHPININLTYRQLLQSYKSYVLLVDIVTCFFSGYSRYFILIYFYISPVSLIKIIL